VRLVDDEHRAVELQPHPAAGLGVEEHVVGRDDDVRGCDGGLGAVVAAGVDAVAERRRVLHVVRGRKQERLEGLAADTVEERAAWGT
jgi:hypothetical protein